MKSTHPNPPQTGQRPAATRLPGNRAHYKLDVYTSKRYFTRNKHGTLKPLPHNAFEAIASWQCNKHPHTRPRSRKAYSRPSNGFRQMNGTRPKPVKLVFRRKRKISGDGANGTRGAVAHAPSMAMTRRHLGRNCVDNDMHTLRKHRCDFIEGTARRSSPRNRFRSMTRVENRAAACTTRRRIPSPKTLPAALGGRQAQA